MLAPYARTETTIIAAIGAIATGVVAWWFGWWGLAPAGLAAALLAFYRDPPRKIPAADNLLLAPADGRIVRVDRVYTDAHDPDAPILRIVIFLSVLNVHINRAPCAGQVTDVHHVPGRFLNALKSEATEQNEHNWVVIDPDAQLPGPVRVRQIAGVLARRIVCTLRAGDVVAAGEKFGMIKLGSQTELRVPESDAWEAAVAPGQRVRAGETVLLRHRGADPNKEAE